jgi:23S rRNA pseudoU1915 N3-methylase RlmH
MTEYDKAYEKVADIINPLYIRLKKFFLPERYPKWQKGYPTGSRLDLEMAMQAEADPRYLEKIWERKTIPHKLDYRFSILVDLSGSMKGKKIEETFKGVVVLAEVLEKLGIQYEILGFSDISKIFKEWKEKLNNELRDKLAEMKNWGGGGTETAKATQRAYQELLKNLGKDNFLITLTDGQPNNAESLKEELEKIVKEKKMKLVGIGLGSDTEFVKDFYKAAFSLKKMNVSDEERRQGQKDFAEAFADLLEDMIRHPEKY